MSEQLVGRFIAPALHPDYRCQIVEQSRFWVHWKTPAGYVRTMRLRALRQDLEAGRVLLTEVGVEAVG